MAKIIYILSLQDTRRLFQTPSDVSPPYVLKGRIAAINEKIQKLTHVLVVFKIAPRLAT